MTVTKDLDQTPMSDTALWRLIVSDNPTAFTTFFDRYVQEVYRFCFRRIGFFDLAQDATSEVFLTAWRRRRDVNVDGPPIKAWLFGVALQIVRNSRRTQLRDRRLIAKIAPESSVEDFSSDSAARVDDELTMGYIVRALTHLTKGEEAVVSLCILGELTYDDASTALGIPIGTVRSRLSRGRAKLKADLLITQPSLVDRLMERGSR